MLADQEYFFFFCDAIKLTNMKRAAFLLATVTTITCLMACNHIGGKRVKGNGNVITQDRSVGAFAGVRSSGSFDIYVSTGPQSVKIEAEENLLPYIESYIDGDILKIDTKDDTWLRNNRKIKIYVSAPHFKLIRSSGSGDIIGQNKITNGEKIEVGVTGSADIILDLDAPEIETEISGSGDASLKGDTRKFSGQINGSGSIKAIDLKTEETEIKINGSGDAEIYASVKLDVRVAGSGDVKYKGGAQVNSNIAGGGKVTKLD